jgi:hypothetical protein
MEADFNMLTTDRGVTQDMHVADSIPPNLKGITKRKMVAIRLTSLDPNVDLIGGKFRLSFYGTVSHLPKIPGVLILVYAKQHRKRKQQVEANWDWNPSLTVTGRM